MDNAVRKALEALETENERLRQENDRLRAMLAPAAAFAAPRAWRLTPSEAAMMRILLARNRATRAELRDAIISGAGADMKTVDVMMSRIRSKLRPLGIEIETVWGSGYCMTRAAKARLFALAEAQDAA